LTVISVFNQDDVQFEPYLGSDDRPEDGRAWIARLVGKADSSTMGAGIVRYERLTVEWNLPFDELITVIEGQMRIHSGGKTFPLGVGSVAWFPAHTPLTYEVPESVVVSYAIYPMPR
jgi:ethanolamine utilization protein EutQ